MDACGSLRRGKAGKCDARLTKLFADIAPEASRISSGQSGAGSHQKRLDDVFGSLNHTLSGASAQAAPSLAALEASAPAARPPAAPAAASRRAAKKPRRKASSPRRPPPKAGYTIETLGRPSSAAAERGAAMSFLRELRERRGGGERPADADDADDAAPRFRKRPRRAGGAAQPKRAAVSLSHLDDMDDGL
jgi:hypothetical protein